MITPSLKILNYVDRMSFFKKLLKEQLEYSNNGKINT